jgi:hypothetical protein
MLPDNHHQRQEQLARVLVATKEAMESLSQYVLLFSDMTHTAYAYFVAFKARLWDQSYF